MGLCNSKPSYIASSDGTEREYQERFLESKTLGQGEFGIVKLVHDVKNKDLIGSKPLAVKMLRKGFTFKDNTLYTPLKKRVLQGEVEILRRLNGEAYNLKLVAVYESPSLIYMVTEYCEGGEMMPWVSKAFEQCDESNNGGLRTEDVSRVCYQLWSAVDHCAKHGVIHRDIKPENVMFCTTERDSQLRLIDFGSGTLDGIQANPDTNEIVTGNNAESEVERHHTFAGSAFYISPEMFQRTYTSKTDVWSAGASLYVLVAGYPADRLQEAFNILQGTKAGRLKTLPNMPENMPESFYEMLEEALVYRYKQRVDAGKLMNCEFSQFHHVHHNETGGGGRGKSPGAISIHEIAAEAAREHAGDTVPEMGNGSGSATRRTTSVLLEGSVHRHNAYLGYQKFERSVTTVLATMLTKDTFRKFLLLLRERHPPVTAKRADSGNGSVGSGTEKKDEDKLESYVEADASRGILDNAEKLQVVTIKVLLDVLGNVEVEDSREVKEVIAMIQSLNNFNLYENFAYHISLLRQFERSGRTGGGGVGDDDGSEVISSVHGNNVWSTFKKKKENNRRLGASGHSGGDPDNSIKSAKSTGGMKRNTTMFAVM